VVNPRRRASTRRRSDLQAPERHRRPRHLPVSECTCRSSDLLPRSLHQFSHRLREGGVESFACSWRPMSAPSAAMLNAANQPARVSATASRPSGKVTMPLGNRLPESASPFGRRSSLQRDATLNKLVDIVKSPPREHFSRLPTGYRRFAPNGPGRPAESRRGSSL